MTEGEALEVLREAFTRAGLRIEDRVRWTDGAAELELDGYDAEARVGYEIIATASGDRAEVTPAVVAALDRAMERGDAHVLLIDEVDVPDRDALRRAAERFLAHIASRRSGDRASDDGPTSSGGAA